MCLACTANEVPIIFIYILSSVVRIPNEKWEGVCYTQGAGSVLLPGEKPKIFRRLGIHFFLDIKINNQNAKNYSTKMKNEWGPG